MITKEEEFLQRLAWQSLYCLRACPPDAILFAADPGAECQAHMTLCPFCRERLEQRSARKALPLGTSLPELPKRPAVSAGQIWSLEPYLAGWGPGDRYYNPPLVLILAVLDIPHRVVQVAQLAPNETLLGVDDLVLEDAHGTAEAWNVYTVRIDDLHRCWGETNPRNVREVIRLSELDIPVPDGIIRMFRDLETDVGAFFAMQSIGKALSVEEAILEMDALRSSNPDWTFPEDLDDPFLAAALATPPRSLLSLAAANEEHIDVTVMRTRDADVQLSMTRAFLVDKREKDDGIRYFFELDGEVSDCREIQVWVRNGDCRKLETVYFEPDSPYFTIQLERGVSNTDGFEFRVVLICHEA